ncbi:uncharacterized protein PGTG_01478 [Puccinia graminis f. sp. tritici CRL 75-36-700-3]|uniref:Uncharacterized protein n=1 Tax=Puccinia graminis f. sp. tritici (strain CRL 75-36-700-3 / race SCCL) TaxID=418459 RepID=E3JS14_PUCGT|nr:uncharacterized protein PGTG_01478 [Puccinia graminis f. sp. tritici CRL 75-36-700-3]EFP74885.1 hypothetical protein PGTG_01478 [Puccinia graminis f. sp. tritici CRL 75-36-700-3]
MPPKLTNQTASSTQLEDTNASGYATDQSQLRQSNRASLVVVEPGMVPTGSDSQVKLTKPARDIAAPSMESGRSMAPRSMPKKKRIRMNQSRLLRGKLKKKLEKEYDNVLDFFKAPVWKQGDNPNTQINYKCKWCGNNYQAQKTSHGNLKVECNGSTQSEKKSYGCVNQAIAKLSGSKLPPSVAERNLAQAHDGGDPKQTIIDGFLQNQPNFFNIDSQNINTISSGGFIIQQQDHFSASCFSNNSCFLYLYQVLNLSKIVTISGDLTGAAMGIDNDTPPPFAHTLQHSLL